MNQITQQYVVRIVDDDLSLRETLRRVLESSGFETRSFESAEAFLERFDGDRTGAVVLDIRMEQIGGLELFEIMRSRRLTCPVIFLTGGADVSQAVRAMKLGAFDFIEKPVSSEALIERIRAAHRWLDEQSERTTEARRAEACLGRLTEAERVILEHLVEGKTSEEIAAELHRSRRTVENHRQHILRKTGAANTAQLVRMVMLAGRERE